MNLDPHLRQLDDEGYTVLPGFLDPIVTAAIRDHLDQLSGPVLAADAAERPVHVHRHPIPGSIMAPLAWSPRLLDVAAAILRAPNPDELEMLEQVLIRTDPSPGPYAVNGWHIDQAFRPEHFESTPRHTYFHMVHCCNTVPAGGGAFTILPGSHKKTYAAAADLDTDEALDAFKADVVNRARLDVSDYTQVNANEGDLLIFNPMCLHSASANSTDQPRYVYFASFMHRDAKYLKGRLNAYGQKPVYPEGFEQQFPANRRHLVYRY